MDYSDAEIFADTPDDELRALAQGCTEESCLYHGPYNIELHRRARVSR